MAKKNDTEAPQAEPISKEVVESYIFSTVRHDFGVYSERLLLRLVELAQCEIRGLDFKGGSSIGKVEIGEWGDAEVVIPVKDILSGEEDKNYTKAKTAVRNLMGKFLEYEDEQKYKATAILNDVDVDKVAGKMVIRVNRNIWRAMLDFTKGFRKYELETVVKLHGKYSLRIYKLVSKQSVPITYSIAELRQMWGLTDKYKKVDDFVKNTIVAAKEELDRVSPYSFDYILNAAKTAEVNKGRRAQPAGAAGAPNRHRSHGEPVDGRRPEASGSFAAARPGTLSDAKEQVLFRRSGNQGEHHPLRHRPEGVRRHPGFPSGYRSGSPPRRQRPGLRDQFHPEAPQGEVGHRHRRHHGAP